MKANQSLTFDFALAETTKTAFTHAGNALDNQASSRNSAVQTAMNEFAGYFSTIYNRNSTIAANDVGELAERFRQIATQIGKIIDSAHRENENRRKAREWDERNEWEEFWDGLTGKQQPNDTEIPPDFTPGEISLSPKELPPLGSVGDNGGISSAVPENLRTANTNLSTLDGELTTPDALQGKLDDFASACQWGSLDASSIISAYRTWMSNNSSERDWLATLADAFERAGGSSASLVSLSNSALQTALEQAGKSTSERQDLSIDPPTVEGAIPTSGFTNDPVNAATGNFVELENDLPFTGIAQSLSLTRMYNSLSDRAGVFGLGWSSALDSQLILSGECARWIMDDGRHVVFPRAGSGWERGNDTALWLSEESSASFPALSLDHTQILVVRDNGGAWWAFDRAGAWLGAGHGPGTCLRVSRDTTGRVTDISHEHGRSLHIEYAGGLVAYIQANDGRRVEYSYEGQHLIKVSTAAGSRTYRWNEEALLESVVSADGVIEVINRYDERRRVIHQRSEFGREIRYTYMSHGMTVVDNEDGTYSNTWIHDSRARLIGIIDADHQRQSMAYDSFGNRVSVTERDGAVTVHGFDSRGRHVRTRTAEGADFTYRYDDYDRVLDVVTATGGVIQYAYASAEDRNPSLVIDPAGGRSELVWEQGLLRSLTGPTGVRVDLEYNEFGEFISVRNAAGGTARCVRNAAGQIVEAVSPAGAVTRFTYDAAGMPVAREDADGALWRFKYTAAGKVKSVTDPTGGITVMEYGPHGELIKTVDPLGRAVTRSFDEMGNLDALLLPGGRSFGFEYDGMMQLRHITDPAGEKWLREYGVNGNLTAVVDPTGVRTSIEEDRLAGVTTVRDAFSAWSFKQDSYGRLIRESDAASDDAGQVYTYDAAGRVVESLDAEGGLTTFEYDLAGNVVKTVSAGGKVSLYTYDECGRPETFTAADGDSVRLVYDADSRVIARVLSDGSEETFTYDAMGRVTEYRSASGSVTRCGYDKLGRLTFVSGPRYGQRRFAYDAAGQLVSVVNGVGGKTTYTYNEAGDLVSELSPTGAITRYDYDVAGRLVSVTDPLGRVNRCGYDAAGRTAWIDDATGNRTAYSYDLAGSLDRLTFNGQLIARFEQDFAARTTQVFDYTNPDGKLAPADTPTQIHTLTSDRLGRLVKHSYGQHVLAWAYDSDGARTRFTVDGLTTDYEYTARGLLASVGSEASGTVRYEYDSSGRLARIVSSDGALNDSYKVVPLDSVSGAEGSSGFAVVRASIDSVSGQEKTATTYYDADSRITAIDDERGLRLFTYDGAQQLTGVQTDEGFYRFTYDAGGRLVAETTPTGQERTYTYDIAGQLLSITDTEEGTYHYIYDGLGRRIRTTGSEGNSQEYAWGPLGKLATITHTSPEGITQQLPLWVNALGTVQKADQCELMWDTAGFIPALAAVDGKMRATLAGATYQSGAWANSSLTPGAFHAQGLNPWGETPNKESHQWGQLSYDPSGSFTLAGMLWMGARVYDPGARGFLSLDPLPSPLGAGWGSHGYAFAGNDPVNLMDPWGLSPVSVQEMAEYQAANPTWVGAVKNWANEHANTIAKVAMATGAVLTVAALVATGPVGMIALGAAGGAALSGGFSILGNKNPDGTVNWGKVGLDTLLGGATGAIGGAGAAATKLTMAVTKSASRFVGSVAVNAGINFTTGAVGGGATYATQTVMKGEDWNWRKFAGNTIGGGMASTIGGFFAPGSGTLAKAVPQLKQRATEFGLNFLGGVTAEGASSMISGEETSAENLLIAGTASSASLLFPTAKASNSSTLNQASYYTPSTLQGAFRGIQARRMWQGGLQGTAWGSLNDLTIVDWLKS